MTGDNSQKFLEKTRREIGRKVRALRLARNMKQAELGGQLGLSQSRLSEIERGAGSFSAEQFLLLLQLFNVTSASFVAEATDAQQVLQNALARFGATHLHESEHVFPAESYDDLTRVVQDTLLDGSARLVTALAPILVRHARQLNLSRLQADLHRLGYERRLPWLVENTLVAVGELRDRLSNRVVSQAASLQIFLDFADTKVLDGARDILDPTIRSSRTVQQVELESSPVSKRWKIVTTLMPEDFVDALRASPVAH